MDEERRRELAKQWLTLAKRADGYYSDSMMALFTATRVQQYQIALTFAREAGYVRENYIGTDKAVSEIRKMATTLDL